MGPHKEDHGRNGVRVNALEFWPDIPRRLQKQYNTKTVPVPRRKKILLVYPRFPMSFWSFG